MFYDAFSAEQKMPKIIFSVGAIEGFKSKKTPWGNQDMLQSEPARERSDPQRELGKVRFIAAKDEFFGGDKSKDYLGPPLVNPTWRQVKGQAQKAMKATGDWHHQFLEGIHFTGKYHDDGSALYEMWMGS